MKKTRHLNGLVLVAVFMLTTQLAQAQTNWDSALQFDGVDDYVVANPGVHVSGGSFTIEAWAKRDTINTHDYILSQGVASANQGLHFGFTDSGYFKFGFFGNDLTIEADSIDTVWHHWAATYDAGSKQRRFFRDGQFIDEDTATADCTGTGPLYIGDMHWYPGYDFNGSIDEVRIWNVARTEAEIQDNMLQPLTGTEAGLVAYYRFDEGEGTMAYDATANANDGLLINGPVWVMQAPLLFWNFQNHETTGSISSFVGLPLISDISGFASQTGGGPTESWLLITRRFGYYYPYVEVTSLEPVRLVGVEFQHMHNHNPGHPTYPDYDVQLQIDSGSGFSDIGELVHISNETHNNIDYVSLADLIVSGTFQIRWVPRNLAYGSDTGSEFFALRKLTLHGVEPIVANAGPDQTVMETPWHLPEVQLDGSYKTGVATPPESVTAHWTQMGGPAVTLSDEASWNPTFTAPLLPAHDSQMLSFKLAVSDGQNVSEDYVDITVHNNNHAPVCSVPDPFEVAEGSSGIALDGSASYDPDSDTLTYSWIQTDGPQVVSLSGTETATATFEAPWIINGGGDILVSEIYQFTLTVNDGQLSDSCDVMVEINNLNHCPNADAGQNGVVAEGATCSLSGLASSDPDNDTLLYAWQKLSGPEVSLDDSASATPSFVTPWVDAGGLDLIFALTVDDQYGCTDTKSVLIHVDNIGDPPTCIDARASIAELWPPNHKMISIGIENIGTGGLPTTTVITGVSQDEPSNGLGDGDTACDAVLSDDASKVMLRAERAGNGNGRVYHVAFIAMNEQGSCAGVVQVGVPLSKKKGAVCVDEGALYPSAP